MSISHKQYFQVGPTLHKQKLIITHLLSNHDVTDLDASKVKTCIKCPTPVLFREKGQLTIHNVNLHTCSICGVTTKAGSIHKCELNPQAAEFLKSCKYPGCGHISKTATGLRKHTRPRRFHETHPTIVNTIRIRECVSGSKSTEIPSADGQHEDGKSQQTQYDWEPVSEKFRCDVVSSCKMQFGNSKELENHRTHHGKFKCESCPEVYSHAPDLAFHELEHIQCASEGTAGKLQCSRCNDTFRKGMARQRFLIHFLDKHLLLPWATVICPICQQGSVLLQWDNQNANKMRKLHFGICHNVAGMNPATIQRCNYCPAYFKTSSQLEKHGKEVHKSIGTFPCSTCGKYFTTQTNLIKHIKNIHRLDSDKLLVKCEYPECTRTFVSEQSMKRHVSFMHVGKVFKVTCPHCKREFWSAGGFRRHELICGLEKKKERPHVCEKCGKGFFETGQLKLHYKTHLGPDSWNCFCEKCGKKCRDKFKLADHMRTHTKEKSLFQCAYCPEAYAHRHNLRHHVNSKHGDIAQDLARTFDKTNLTSRKGIPIGKRKLGSDDTTQPGPSRKGKRKKLREPENTSSSESSEDM